MNTLLLTSLLSTLGCIAGTLLFVISIIMALMLLLPARNKVWQNHSKKDVGKGIVGIFILSIILLTCSAPKETPVPDKEKVVADKTPAKTMPSYFNADTLQAYYSAPPLNFYFVKHDGVGTYSTYDGYVTKEIAESPYEYDKPKSPAIQIQFDPVTKEIYRARLSIKNLTSITPKPSEMKYVFDFIATLSPEAASKFQRNFSTVFCYTTKATDSSEFIDEGRKIKAHVYNDLDMVAKKAEKLSKAFIEVNIENTGNEYKYDETKVSQAKKERQELVEKAFSPYDGSHRKLTDYIKAHMNDPESFEHVETTYIDRPGNGYVEVKEIFRGKNAYNATVLNTVWAKCKVEGDVIEIEKQ